MKKLSARISTALCFLICISFLFSLRSYPYADEWVYASSVDFAGADFWKWIFSQHVDHFIPIQKFLHHYLAKWGGFDFRVLVLFNLVIAVVVVDTSINLAKIYRKQMEWGDLWIVFCILSPSATYLLWGFQFQFLSSFAFFVVSVTFFSLSVESKRPQYFTLGILFLILTAVSGMNGLVLAAVSSVIVTAGLFLIGETSIARKTINKILIIFLNLIFIVIVFNWVPSNVAQSTSDISEKLKFFYLLHSGPFSIAAFKYSAFFALFVILFSLLSCIVIIKKFFNKNLSATDVFLAAALIASEVLLLSVAFGRAGFSGWSNAILMHYSTLAIMPLIFSWIILTGNLYRRNKNILGVMILGLVLFSFHKAYNWRQQHSANTIATQLDVEKALTQIFDARDLIDKYALKLTWKDNDVAKSYVENGLIKLMSQSYPRYKSQPPYVLREITELNSSELNSSITVDASSVLSVSGWNGSDFDKTVIDGLQVYGSYLNPDLNVGSIMLMLKRGDRLIYRSGPTPGHQVLEIEMEKKYIFTLPVSIQWRLIEFSSPNLRSNFKVKFFDNGKSWGEWSAIGVLK